jgi:hypothetical protein
MSEKFSHIDANQPCLVEIVNGHVEREWVNCVGFQLTTFRLNVGSYVDTQCTMLTLDSPKLQIQTVCIDLTSIATQQKVAIVLVAFTFADHRAIFLHI